MIVIVVYGLRKAVFGCTSL